MKKNFFLPVILFSFFLSGFSSLAYQILWTRLITLFFGHTTLAITTVLSIFMAGLALGSFLMSRLLRTTYGSEAISTRAMRLLRHFVPRNDNLLLIYAILQVSIGIYGLFSGFLINTMENLVLTAGILNMPAWLQYLCWFFVSLLILIIPTTLMGATLPVLSQWINKNIEEVGTRVGWLYGFNTFGAVTGVFLFGYFLIPLLGMKGSLSLSASVNILSGVLVYFLFKYNTNGNEVQPAPSPLPFTPEARPAKSDEAWREDDLRGKSGEGDSHLSNLLLVLVFLSGFAGMALEIAWTRILITIIGSSTYAFSNVLIVVLLGISLGSMCFGKLQKYFPVTLRNLAFLEILIVFFIAVSLPLFNYLPYLLLRILSVVCENTFLQYSVQFLICVFMVFIPAFFMGLAFPWIIQLACRDSAKAGEVTGRYYAFNSIGGVIGSLTGGFLWLPALGVEKTFLLILFVYILAVAAIWIFIGLKKNIIILPVLTVLIFGILISPKWDTAIISSGMFMYANLYDNVRSYSQFKKVMHQNRILYYKDGITCNVSVLEDQVSDRFLRVNGKTDASNSFEGDMSTQLFLGYLPVMLHPPGASGALVIGLGSGVTLSAIASFREFGDIDCVEIEPAVKEVQGFFKDVNLNVLDDKRVKLIFTDARQYLKTGKRRYDIITSEPSNPWIAGVANLYTVEAFELVKERLNNKGIFCQWVHGYSMSEKDFRMILKTFLCVYPNAYLFVPKINDYLLIGSAGDYEVNYSDILKAFSKNYQMKHDLGLLGYNHPFTAIANTYLLDSRDIKNYAGEVDLHFDDRPTLEFSAPLNLYKKDDPVIYSNLCNIKKTSFPGFIRGFNPAKSERVVLNNSAGESFMRSKNLSEAEKYFKKALELSSGDARAFVNMGRVYNILGKELQAREFFEKAISVNPGYALAYFHLGMLYVTQGIEDKGLKYMEKGLKISPNDPMGASQVARIYARKGRTAEAKELLKNALAHPVSSPSLRRSLERQLDEL